MDRELAAAGARRVDWMRSRMALLDGVRREFAAARPFAGLTIGVSLHLEPKTAVLLETLQAGGARIVGTGNYGSTQDDIVAFLKAAGMEIDGSRATPWDEHLANVARIVAATPDLLLDNGADLAAAAVAAGTEGKIRGGTEETTSGGDRLRDELANRVSFPVIVINDSPLKRIVENKHAVGQGTVESFMRVSNLIVNGRRFVVLGYGWCGRGIAQSLKAFGGHVGVVEVDPVKQLEAAMDGFRVGRLEALAPWGEVFVTATARPKSLGRTAFARMADGAVLLNTGHFPDEIDVEGLRALSTSSRMVTDDIEEFALEGGRRIALLTGGRMINLAGREPKGNSIESMDLGFMLQALSLERLATAPETLAAGPQAVPDDINRTIAERMVAQLMPDA